MADAQQEHYIAATERDRWMEEQSARYVGQSGGALIWKNDAGVTFVVWSAGPGRLRIVVKPPNCAC
jgi:hypothetical protein